MDPPEQANRLLTELPFHQRDIALFELITVYTASIFIQDGKQVAMHRQQL